MGSGPPGTFEILTPVLLMMVGSSILLSLTYLYLYRGDRDRHLYRDPGIGDGD